MSKRTKIKYFVLLLLACIFAFNSFVNIQKEAKENNSSSFADTIVIPASFDDQLEIINEPQAIILRSGEIIDVSSKEIVGRIIESIEGDLYIYSAKIFKPNQTTQGDSLNVYILKNKKQTLFGRMIKSEEGFVFEKTVPQKDRIGSIISIYATEFNQNSPKKEIYRGTLN